MASDPNLSHLLAGYTVVAFFLCGYLFSLLYRHSRTMREHRRLSALAAGGKPIERKGVASP